MVRAYVLLLFLATGLDVADVRPDVQVATETVDIDVPVEFRDLENAGIACVALAVYAEARGSSWDAQAMVAHVVLQRQASRTGADPCDVVTERGQFLGLDAWAYPRTPWRDNPRAWAFALDVARAVMSNDYAVPPRCIGAQHFYARGAARPSWAPDGAVDCEVGPFVFLAPLTAGALSSTGGGH